ncbi:MAG TPA: metal ABC transporter permease, partial [Candidatus Babeliales bacterium]|nr:metal ABC transporter permease [Candidatus Babeliales bacterium]
MLHIEIVTIAILAAVTCCLPGVFLVLRGVAMMSDAISHAILLGIVVMFLIIKNLTSSLLIIGASASGILTVLCTELIIKSKRLKQDAAIGLVFPLFFSVGVILVSQFARNVHLDTDMVLLGELAFTPFNRLIINNIDCGPYALWIMGAALIVNLLFVRLLYKEL